MMLSQQEISATPIGAAKLRDDEKVLLMPQLPDWEIVSVDNVEQLCRAYSLRDFSTAIHFSNKVAAISERSNHHPKLTVQWGQLTVYWWSHSIAGLHLNDLVMAAKTDEIYKSL